MSYELDAKFFRKAKKLNRAVEITDNEAIIPAVKDQPEIRVPLPNRRLKTMEERMEEIQGRKEQIVAIEEEIEVKRKELLSLVNEYNETKTGIANVVVKNMEIKTLIDQRSKLAHPSSWIESKEGLTFKDIFERKRDIRKIGEPVFQIKRRVEPIESLYIDLGAAAALETAKKEQEEAAIAEQVRQAEEEEARKQAAKAAKVPTQRTAAEAAQGAIIGQRRAIKVKNPSGIGPS